MILKSRRLLLVTLGLSMLAIGATAAWILNLHQSTAIAAPIVPHFSGHFSLTTADGRAVTDESYRGKWLVVYFGYTFCPDSCPTTLSSISLALERLGPLADQVQPLFITLDPARDSPALMASYAQAFDPRIVPLVGTPDQIAAAAKAYRVSYVARDLGDGSYSIDHSSFVYVLDPQGSFVRLLTGDAPGHQLAEELQQLLR